MPLKVINVNRWIEENKGDFKPPVCNKLMWNEQLNVMFVGGPNSRKDYHIESGEEVFLLPGRIPHSPQRFANTVGLVIERRRAPSEFDTLRYYTNSNAVLWEKDFFCTDLVKDLGPVLQAYKESTAFATGIPDKLPSPLALTKKCSMNDITEPFAINRPESKGLLFQGENVQSIVVVHAGKTVESVSPESDVFLMQLEGKSTVTVGSEKADLEESDCLILRNDQTFTISQDDDGAKLLSVRMPTPKS